MLAYNLILQAIYHVSQHVKQREKQQQEQEKKWKSYIIYLIQYVDSPTKM